MTTPRTAIVAKLVAALLVCSALVGCDATTSLDPRDLLFKHVQKPLPGTDQPYPNLGSVPDGPPPATPKQERINLEQKLAADNKSQVYKPDTSKSPPVPAPPAPLPSGFIDAKKPVALPGAKTAAEATGTKTADSLPGGAPSPAPTKAPPMPSPPAEFGAAPSPPQMAEMTRPSVAAPEFGALGRPQRVAVVLFASGSAEIDPAQVAELKPVVALLREHGGVLQVVGYASRDRGAAENAAAKIANFNLSLDRANAVGRVLMRLGVKSDQLVLSAEGDSSSTTPIDGVSGPAANQRADIFIEY